MGPVLLNCVGNLDWEPNQSPEACGGLGSPCAKFTWSLLYNSETCKWQEHSTFS